MDRKFGSYTVIEDQAAWERGRLERIKANRRVGAKARWVALVGEEISTRCDDFLNACGQFDSIPYTKAGDRESGYDGYITCFRAHPIVALSQGDFYTKMRDNLAEWGGLTEGQTKAVLKMIERADQRLAEREAAKVQKAATAQHIGTVGERIDFDLTIKFTTDFETQFGYTYVHVMEDAAGNVVVYKGSKVLGQKGDAVKFKATIKAHDYRDGIAQTIVTRPK